ncbi:MAG: hypothetical protein GVY13_06230 [Alphaproteobacteria bacterium]|jgi:hypothetical protein|nr:hypothetical protein [Alphaproteobacteria bacterium]
MKRGIILSAILLTTVLNVSTTNAQKGTVDLGAFSVKQGRADAPLCSELPPGSTVQCRQDLQLDLGGGAQQPANPTAPAQGQPPAAQQQLTPEELEQITTPSTARTNIFPACAEVDSHNFCYCADQLAAGRLNDLQVQVIVADIAEDNAALDRLEPQLTDQDIAAIDQFYNDLENQCGHL